MDLIGQTLKQEREKRGLSLEDAHEATKITVQNLAALEEDKFDAFPNKVYARAFLRDYANYLNLDSASLLAQYEELCNPVTETEVVPVKNGGSAWRAIGYVVLVLVIAGGLAAAGYFGYSAYKHKSRRSHNISAATRHRRDDVATMPSAAPIAPPKPETAPKPEATKPQPPPVPQKLTLQVTPTEQVWARVDCDGQKAFEGILGKDQIKTFEAKKNLHIRLGKAGAAQLKLNGQPQPLLGTSRLPGEKTFTLPPPSAAPAAGAPAATPAAPAAPAPAANH